MCGSNQVISAKRSKKNSRNCNWIHTLFGYQLIIPDSESKPKVTIFFVSLYTHCKGNKTFCCVLDNVP